MWPRGKIIGYIITTTLLCWVLPLKSQSGFQKVITGNPGFKFSKSIHQVSADGGFIVLSPKPAANSLEPSYTHITKTDVAGNIQWARKFTTQYPCALSAVVALPDSGFIFATSFNAYTDLDYRWMNIFKTDKDGNTIWRKTYGGAHFTPYFALEYRNDALYIAGIYNLDPAVIQWDIFLMKLNLVDFTYKFDKWAPFGIEGNTVEDIILLDNGNVAICGYHGLLDSLGKSDPYVLLADSAGKFMGEFELNISGESNGYSMATRDNKIYLAGTTEENNATEGFLIEMGSGPGLPAAVYTRFLGAKNMELYGVAVDENKNIFLSGSYENSLGTKDNLLLKTDSSKKITWAKTYAKDPLYNGTLRTLHLDKNSMLTMAGGVKFTADSMAVYIGKADKDGSTGCPSTPVAVQVQTMPLATKQMASVKPLANFFEAPEVPDWQSASLTIKEYCLPDTAKAGFIPRKSNICSNTEITFTDTSHYATRLQWSFAGAIPATATGKTVKVKYTSPGTYTVRLVASNAASSDTAYDTITVNPTPVGFAGKDTTLCRGQSLQLAASGSVFFSWHPGSMVSDSTIANPVTTPDSTMSLRLIVKDSIGCADTASIKITVLQKPETQVLDSTICQDKKIVLDAVNRGFAFLWSTGHTTQTITADTGAHNVIISNSCFTDTSYFYIKGEDCTPRFYIPDAFTPNNDGLNDVFTVSGENLVSIEMNIFNRWGEILFSQNGTQPAWNGTYKNQPIPDGVYIYTLSLLTNAGERINQTGNITLLR